MGVTKSDPADLARESLYPGRESISRQLKSIGVSILGSRRDVCLF